YASFSGAGLDGGFTTESPAGDGGLLVVLFSDDLEASRAGVAAAGGVIVRDIFSFPGGRRFHFADPNGNVLAVWGHDPVAG
ncbi:MAG: VOC family protein, partial [Actinobacteria bacterium]|nr:VOC family protein [Actinomycetota bacterium]NIS32643.1 VOC family protein [Actinomycetota bacterium]NIT96386.1 VOC family protein [Actinomycetota bacterium]NIU67649.1 VOC family protein [Actinomycetota bacterium]NIV56551.1 VOC family protein [Actinomycetota bacterium]